MKMTTSFQNREEALEKICGPTEIALLNVYGEAGIGKSRLLQEAAQIPIRPRTQSFPLQEANRALQLLKADQIERTGVLVVGDGTADLSIASGRNRLSEQQSSTV